MQEKKIKKDEKINEMNKIQINIDGQPTILTLEQKKLELADYQMKNIPRNASKTKSYPTKIRLSKIFRVPSPRSKRNRRS